MPQQGSFGIQLHGYQVLQELPRSSSRTRVYRVRPMLHEDLPRCMASEETCYVLKCVAITGAGQKPKSRGAANESQVLREVSALLKLRHSNIVPYHKVFTQDGRVCTMMGSMETASLRDVVAGLSKGQKWAEDFKDCNAPANTMRFEPRLIWHFLIQLLEGVDRLHRCSIVHRALKPSNLLLEPETCFTHPDFRWRLKISDVAVPELLRRDNFKIPAARLRYMAPELLAASAPYDWKTDMWAVGCTLFEMLALRRAFRTAGDIASGTLNPLPSDTDAGLITLLELLLSFDPEARPTAADALALHSVAEKYADWPFAAWLADGDSSNPPIRYDAASDTSRRCWAQHPADGQWYVGQITSAIASTPADCFMVNFAELDDNTLCWHNSVRPFRQLPLAGTDASAPRSPASLKSGVVVGFGKADVLKVRGPVPLEDSLSSVADDFDSDKSDVEEGYLSGGTSKRGAMSGTAPRFSMLGRLLPSSFTDGAESIAGIATWSGRTNPRSVTEEFSGFGGRRVAPAPTPPPPARTTRPNSAPAEVSDRKTPEPSKREPSRRVDDTQQTVGSLKPISGGDSAGFRVSSRSANAGSVATRDATDMREHPRKKSSACAIL